MEDMIDKLKNIDKKYLIIGAVVVVVWIANYFGLVG